MSEVLFDSIAQTAWMTLAMSALLSTDPDGEDGSTEPPEEWQKNVLKTFGNRLSKGFDDLPQSARDPNAVQPLLQALSSSVQEKVGMRKSTDMLLKLLSDQ